MKNNQTLMPTSQNQLLEQLNNLKIDYTLYEHEAVFTVTESKKTDALIPAHHTRNLFLRTKKKKTI